MHQIAQSHAPHFLRLPTPSFASAENERSTREPPYIAEHIVELPLSTVMVLSHEPPVLGVTLSLILVVVSHGPYARSQQSLCPHAPICRSASVISAAGGGFATGLGSWSSDGRSILSGWYFEYVAYLVQSIWVVSLIDMPCWGGGGKKE
jgi:hypothetical protein